MPITVSTNITDPLCVTLAAGHVQAWQPMVGHLPGDFEIQHGEDKTCAATHGLPFNEGFWIVALPRGCRVFLSEQGNPLDYAGAGNHFAYCGGCSCGQGH